MFRKTFYKDRPAVVLETARFRAVFLPEDGAKFASLVQKSTGRELLLNHPGDRYRVLEFDGAFARSECSGFDDMFPTIDPWTPQEGPFAGRTYPDHGESCRLPHEAEIVGDKLYLRARSRVFPVSWEKVVSPTPDGGICLAYRYCNHGEAAFPFVWAGHILLAGADDLRLESSFPAEEPIELLGAAPGTDLTAFPWDRLTGFVPGRGSSYKYYFPRKMPEGRFAVRYGNGDRLVFTFNEKKLPYLGIWVDNGLFRDMYTIAPEPCNVPYDAPNKAEARGYSAVIEGGGEFAFTLNLDMEE